MKELDEHAEAVSATRRLLDGTLIFCVVMFSMIGNDGCLNRKKKNHGPRRRSNGVKQARARNASLVSVSEAVFFFFFNKSSRFGRLQIIRCRGGCVKRIIFFNVNGDYSRKRMMLALFELVSLSSYARGCSE